MALVRSLAELHGGGVSVESEVGKGSRFTISLPWQVTARRAAKKGADGISVAEGATDVVRPPVEAKTVESLAPTVTVVEGAEAEKPLVLLAEDHETNINTISDYLVTKGYRVVVARNGGEAIKQAKEARPDVILMDIQMPRMNGLEATRYIRADADQDVAMVPIIALTALVMPGDRERCLAAGVNEYLSKPVRLRELINAIEHLTSQGRLTRQ